MEKQLKDQEKELSDDINGLNKKVCCRWHTRDHAWCLHPQDKVFRKAVQWCSIST
jgi:hypothetical protein